MELIKEWWGAIMAVSGLGVWMIRLESSTKIAMRVIARLERQMESDRKAAQSARQETNDMLREMRGDIKRLLERNRS
ncbi:hypothetical protein [Paracoccus sp. MKU1]|uniref:hypothetical protein n=1 Tax=Paracoccus sp. MKU1 TaxID=1745182 RepID=UPI0007F03C19|nr:hypothetical protein [Paracoccus sp. MKU1]